MRNLKLLIAALLINCSLFAISPAKADPKEDNQEHNHDSDNGNKRNDNNGEKLPINNQTWVLIIAGIAIGCTVIISKNKKAKLKHQKNR